MKRLEWAICMLIVSAAVVTCRSQPPPPPPASPLDEGALARLTSELGEDPVIAFFPRIDPVGDVPPLYGRSDEGTVPEKRRIVLDNGAVVKSGQRYLRPDGEIVSFSKMFNIKKKSIPDTSDFFAPLRLPKDDELVYIGYECTVHLPEIRGLLLNRGDYRLAVVATTTPGVFDSLASCLSLQRIFEGEQWTGVTMRGWQLGMAEYPEHDVAEFSWRFPRRMAIEGNTLSFVAWRNRRLAGARPEDWDSEIVSHPVGQVILREDGFTVLRGGLQ